MASSGLNPSAFVLARQIWLPAIGRGASPQKNAGSANMLSIIIVAVAVLVLFLVATPAIWSKNPARRADAREVLRMILTAFGCRPV
jgi:hypothetical protein